VYFGRSTTKLEGGVFTVRILFSTKFPYEQPRVAIITPFFHANVTEDGIPYYRTFKPDSAQAHIEAILTIFEKEMNSEPTCVINRKCAELYWRSGEEGKREYSKQMRKIVSRSIEWE
jgi:ubiquitin-conjugating enzyme E2 Z